MKIYIKIHNLKKNILLRNYFFFWRKEKREGEKKKNEKDYSNTGLRSFFRGGFFSDKKK